jgi:hypothetical protein
LKKLTIGFAALACAVLMTATPAWSASSVVQNIKIDKQATLSGGSVTITGSFNCKHGSNAHGRAAAIHGAVAQGVNAQGGAFAADCVVGDVRQTFEITTNGGGFSEGKADACVSGQTFLLKVPKNDTCRKINISAL